MKAITEERGLCVLVLIVMTAVFSIGTVYAFFLSSSTMENQLTVKDNAIRINEMVDYPDEIIPGQITMFQKDVSVTNTGSAPCDVTVTIAFSSSEMERMTSLDYRLGEEADAWTRIGDGKYRYNSTLNSGDSTTSLFTKATVCSPNVNDKIEDFQIYVYAESYYESQNLQ